MLLSRTGRVLAAAAIAVLPLSGCGEDPTQPNSPAANSSAEQGAHNDADVEFAAEMIPHHAQALHMVDMADDRDNSAEFAQLLADIEKAQGPEIEQMAGWLKAWGEDAPETDIPMGGGGGHGGMGGHMDGDDLEGMPGMMSNDDFDELGQARDDAFEEMWLRMMIEHHEGAITMAKAELEDGAYGPATELAQSIATSQRKEIQHMERMLKG